MRRSIRWRLAIYQIVVISLAMIGVAVGGERSVRRYYLQRMERYLFVQATMVRRALLPDLIAGALPPEHMAAELRTLSVDPGVRIVVTDAQGQVIGDSTLRQLHADLSGYPEFATFCQTPFPWPQQYAHAVRDDGMHVAVPVARRHQLAAVIRLTLGLYELDDQLKELRTLFLGVVLITTAAAVVFTLCVTRSITGPIQEVTEVAQRMAAGDLAQRVVANPDDEIGQLARAFNSMAARIQDMMGQLGQEREKMSHVFAQMTDGLLVVDAGARLVMINPAAEAILEIEAREHFGRRLHDIAPLSELARIADEVLLSGQEHREEIVCRGPEERAIEVSAIRMADRPGAAPGAMLVLHDWTAIWRADRMRRDLVANASHELRTPIAAVKMMVETLLQGAQEEPEVRERFLTLVAREADRLSQLVSDLLDLSQLEAGQWRLEIEEFALRDVAEQALAKFSVVARERRQTLSGKCPPDVYVRADKRAVSQILSNLIENATKYTPEGGEIWFWAEADAGHTRLSVRDTGVGIPQEHLVRVFERFYRVDKARAREMGGSGLGLAIVKHLVDALGGAIEAQSEPGKGSTFIVTLAAPESGGRDAKEEPAPCRIEQTGEGILASPRAAGDPEAG